VYVLDRTRSLFSKLFLRLFFCSGVVTQSSEEANYVKIRAKYGPTPYTRQTSSTRNYSAAVHGNVYRHGASRAYVNRADLLRANAKEGSAACAWWAELSKGKWK